MRFRPASVVLAAASIAVLGWPALARDGRSLTITRPPSGLHRHGDRRTAASPNVPVPDEAFDSVDGPTAHGNCSTAGGGSGTAAMAASNC